LTADCRYAIRGNRVPVSGTRYTTLFLDLIQLLVIFTLATATAWTKKRTQHYCSEHKRTAW